MCASGDKMAFNLKFDGAAAWGSPHLSLAIQRPHASAFARAELLVLVLVLVLVRG
jgi:hypothetical protein